MNINILKQISLLSLFLGGALGVLTPIPFVDGLALWTVLLGSAPIVIIFMLKMKMLDIQTVKESIVLGSIIGFISLVGFALFYIPITVVLMKLFHYSANQGMGIIVSQANLLVFIIFIIFVGILSATINAFSGFLTFYGVDLYKMLNKKNEKFEVKDNDGI